MVTSIPQMRKEVPGMNPDGQEVVGLSTNQVLGPQPWTWSLTAAASSKPALGKLGTKQNQSRASGWLTCLAPLVSGSP